MTKSKGTETISDAQLLSELKEYLSYNPNTGIFTWAKQVGARGKIGEKVGCLNRGYIRIKVNRTVYLAHRLAWLFYYGYLPKDLIDHIDGVKDNNRINNLREANTSQNQHNQRKPRKDNTSGYLGVTFNKGSKKFTAKIRTNGIVKHLGVFTDPKEAHQTYLAAKRELHPFSTI